MSFITMEPVGNIRIGKSSMKYSILLCFILASFFQFAYALSTKDLPEISGLEALLNAPDPKDVKKNIKQQNGVIASGLRASDSQRGVTAATLAKLLSNGSADSEKQFIDAFEQERKLVEQYLQQNNFAVGDVGVAYALSFISLWELSHNRILSPQAELEAGKYIVHMFDDLKAEFAKISDVEKDKAYDWYMATPIAFVGLYKGFKKQGSEQNMQDLSKTSQRLFKEVFRFPHTYFTFSDKGEFGINTDALLSDARKTNGTNTQTAPEQKKSDW